MMSGNTPTLTSSKVAQDVETQVTQPQDKSTASSFTFGSSIGEKTDFGFGVTKSKQLIKRKATSQLRRAFSTDFEQVKVTPVNTEVPKATTEGKKNSSGTSLVFGTPKATSSESPKDTVAFSFSLPAKRPSSPSTGAKTSSTTSGADTQFSPATALIVSTIPSHPPTELSLTVAGLSKQHLQRHHEYYISDGNVIFLAEHILFRLHRSTLVKHSPVFQGMWLRHGMVEDPDLEGSSDAKPIVLDGVKAIDFCHFLWMLYPPMIGTNKARTLDEWTSILEQSHMWQTESIKSLAVKKLNKMAMEPIAKIELWQKCGLHGSIDLLCPYISVCQRVEALSLNEAKQLGIETFVKVVEVRDMLRQCTHCSEDSEQEGKAGSSSDDKKRKEGVEAIVLKAFALS